MRRHLTPSEATAALLRGASVQQFLGFADRKDGRATLKYLEISPREDKVVIYAQHVFDDGNDNFFDVGEFTPVEEWDPFDDGGNFLGGEDPSKLVCASATEALTHAATHLGASPDRWVNSGMVDAEYQDARRSRRTNTVP